MAKGDKKHTDAQLEKAVTDATKELNDANKQLLVVVENQTVTIKTLKEQVAGLEEENKAGELLTAAEPPELSEADLSLIGAACEVYGIPEEHVLSANVRDGAAVIVTNGGAKVRLSADMDPEKIKRLSRVQVTGVKED